MRSGKLVLAVGLVIGACTPFHELPDSATGSPGDASVDRAPVTDTLPVLTDGPRADMPAGSGGGSGVAGAGATTDGGVGGGGVGNGSGGTAGAVTGTAGRAASGGGPTGNGGMATASGGAGGRGSGGAVTASGGRSTGGMVGTGGVGSGGAMTGSGGQMCTATQHNCSGTCVDNNSILHCGGLCDACTAPAGGTPTCDGTRCDFTCGTMRKCPTKCTTGCCADADCPPMAGMAGRCDTSTNTCNYSCATGFKPCGAGTCIPMANCCTASDCAGTCRTCSAAGACVAVTNADDTDSCPGTCDATGACKSKRGQTCMTGGGCITGTTCAPDGICCNTACTGSCEACDIAGQLGTCTPVASGNPHGNRASCAGTNATCAGTCAGLASGQCSFPVRACGTAMCSGVDFVDVGMCSGGNCTQPAARACAGNLICSGSACKTSCMSNADCRTGLLCVNGACQSTCPAGLTNCSGTCVNLQTDPAHCGSCTATACNGTCQSGVCCGVGLTNCSGVCVDLTSDDKHCGACSGGNTDCTLSGRAIAHCRNSLCRFVDGFSCTSDGECFNGLCNPLYSDTDGDGYPSRSLARMVRFCGSSSVDQHYISARPDGKWDCCDESGVAHPGATDFIPWGPNSIFFDLECQNARGDTNCDGTIEVDPLFAGASQLICQLNGSVCESTTRPVGPEDCGSSFSAPCSCDATTCQRACGPGFTPVGCR